MRLTKPVSFASALALAFALALPAGPPAASGGQDPRSVPTPEGLERALFNEINRERAVFSLPALSPSPALAALARAHSADMARRDVLGHISADGRTYTRRLEAAAVLFAANGENVVSSSVPDPGRIHGALMNTGGHRENILRPDFDEAGVGVARSANGTFYVTQDFIKSVPVLGEAGARAFILAALDATRKSRGLLPLLSSEDVDRTARSFALARSEGRPYPEVPERFGETRVAFAAGPDLAALAEAVAEDPLERYTLAGVGAVFARTPEHPGGAHFVCVLLLVGEPSR